MRLHVAVHETDVMRMGEAARSLDRDVDDTLEALVAPARVQAT